MRNPDQQNVAFAFLTYKAAQENMTLVVLHSLLFQLVTNNKTLRPVLAYNHKNNYHKLTDSHEFVRDLLRNILTNLPTTYFILDGLDEIAEKERSMLLSYLQTLQKDSPNLKLLISSRAEYDIGRSLGSECSKISLHHRNSKDIAEYVMTRTNKWLMGLDLAPELLFDIKNCTKEIAPKSKGKFLPLLNQIIIQCRLI